MNIDTIRTRLRPLRSVDVDNLVRLDSDPAVMRYVSGGAPTSREVVEEWVIPRAQAERRAHGTGIWSIVDRHSARFVGWIALRTPRHSGPAELELSYRLQRSVWGRGLATEASHALLSFAFDELGSDRVFAGTMAGNLGSRRVMEKLGMSLVGIHVTDERIDAGGPQPSVLHFLADGGFDRAEVEYEIRRATWAGTLTARDGTKGLTA
ncbi:GNAT family N-acetyltransferase [Gordonia sp. ABSL1-1]|uniref:GNAT family N-acetyltransferase n=1 Tax=Gordonia sp. ABSL1-1 TaxID=3053923 RepID=UPI002573DBC8|nr:GNAT family N-acetyltransferase [Gordonia sp. ABSL1-1]MDL9937273.1 GNAT family N-acetyltransferase [Gordonia sp. ABSL1-1]